MLDRDWNRPFELQDEEVDDEEWDDDDDWEDEDESEDDDEV